MIQIDLTDDEWAYAERVGLLRMSASKSTGRYAHRNQTRSDEHRVWHERLGAAAELAVAKHLGIPYEGTVNTFHAEPDVGRFDVRATHHRNGSLIIRDNDDIERPFVLVIGDGVPGTPLHLVGWAFGYDAVEAARRTGNVRQPHGKPKAWFCPQGELRPVPQTAL